MKKCWLTLGLLALFFPFLSGQTVQDDLLQQIAANFETQLEVFPQEKIHLHTDRDIYVPGEKIWFKAYVTDAATLAPVTQSRYVYVELISPADTLIHRVMVRQVGGMYYGFLPLNAVVPEGDYTLRAYTRYMENFGDGYFFKKNIKIGGLKNNYELKITNYEKGTSSGNRRSDLAGTSLALAQNDYDVSFFPEGGNLLEGAFCKVAFKALNKDGTSEQISGKIVDEKDAVVTSVETFYAGMGTFSFIPAHGKKYWLKCRNSAGLEKQFELPAAYPNACALTVLQRNKRITVEVRKSAGSPELPCYLLGHCRGQVFHFAALDNLNDPIAFSEEDLPAGVLQFVLFDRQMNPLSERLVFNKTNSTVKIEFQTDKTVYEKREKVVATIRPPLTPPKEGNTPSLSGREGVGLSVAIIDDKDIAVDESTTILSSLLLSSELKGYIENPAWYLQDNMQSTIALDYLMLTHGWRRYNIPEVVKGNPAYPQIPYQTSQRITGSVKSPALSKPLSNSELLIMANEDIGFTTTDGNGKFTLKDFEYPDSTAYFIQALSAKGSKMVELVVDNEEFPRLIHAVQSPHLTPTLSKREGVETDDYPSQNANAFIEKASQRSKYDDDMRMVYLNEIVVTAPKIEKKDESRLQIWANRLSDMTIRREDFETANPKSVNEVLKYFPSARVSSTPLVLIDGVPMHWPQDDKGNFVKADFPTSPLEQININDVESIDIIKGVETSMFGTRGAGGVISITTTTGLDAINRANKARERFQTNFTVYTPLGYQKPVEFYAPKYETLEAKQQAIPDYRTTIYWKPDLVISEESENATFEFYTSDFPTTYSIVIEGLTDDGKIIRQVEKIVVE